MEQPIHSCWTLTKNGNAEHCQTRAGELHCWTSWSSPIGPATLGYWFAKGHFKLTRKSPRECGKWPSLTSSLSACRLLDFESRLTSGPRGPKTSMKRTCSVRATTNMAEQEGDATFSFVALEPLQLAKDNSFRFTISASLVSTWQLRKFLSSKTALERVKRKIWTVVVLPHCSKVIYLQSWWAERSRMNMWRRSIFPGQLVRIKCDKSHVIIVMTLLSLLESDCLSQR